MNGLGAAPPAVERQIKYHVIALMWERWCIELVDINPFIEMVSLHIST